MPKCISCQCVIWHTIQRELNAPLCKYCAKVIVVPYLMEKHPELIAELEDLNERSSWNSENKVWEFG